MKLKARNLYGISSEEYRDVKRTQEEIRNIMCEEDLTNDKEEVLGS